MEDGFFSLAGTAALSISADDADALLQLKNGSAALLYLYLLRGRGAGSAEAAAEALGLTAEQVRAAAGQLRSAGLLRKPAGQGTDGPPAGGSAEKPAAGEKSAGTAVPVSLPAPAAEDISRLNSDDPAFADLLKEMACRKGSPLTNAEIGTLYSIYKDRRLSAELVLLMAAYCEERARRRGVPGYRLKPAELEQEAYIWAGRGILTLEQAEEWLAGAEEREKQSAAVQAMLGLGERPLVDKQQMYVDGWIAAAYPRELIHEAYGITVTNKGGMNWPYMNSILKRWAGQGLKTLDDVRKKDAPPRGGKAGGNGGASPGVGGRGGKTTGERLGGSASRNPVTNPRDDLKKLQEYLDSLEKE